MRHGIARNAIVLAVVLVALQSRPACADPAPEPPETPETAFRAFQVADEKGDLAGMLKFSTDRSRDFVLGLWIIDAFVDRAFALAAAAGKEQDPDEVKARFKLIEDVLVRHGHKERFFDRFPEEFKEFKEEKDGPKILAKIMAPIRDKDVFAKELHAAWKKVDATWKARPILRGYELKNLVVTGESARAAIIRKMGKKLTEEPVGFRKLDGVWKIELLVDTPAKGNDNTEKRTLQASPVEIIAHRGASFDAPENTVAAIRLAWTQKADASEFDVFLSKDGKIVVLHDADTKRVAGVDKKVAEQTLAELRELDVGRWKGAKFAGEKIPTLDEMLATVPAGKRVFVEVKTGPEIVPELDRVLKASKLKPEQTPIISFHADVIAAVKKARPDLTAYWIVRLDKEKKVSVDALIEKAKSIRADGLDLSGHPAMDRAFAAKIKDAGLKFYVWTINDAGIGRRLVEIGVDGITTDRPGWLRERLAN